MHLLSDGRNGSRTVIRKTGQRLLLRGQGQLQLPDVLLLPLAVLVAGQGHGFKPPKTLTEGVDFGHAGLGLGHRHGRMQRFEGGLGLQARRILAPHVRLHVRHRSLKLPLAGPGKHLFNTQLHELLATRRMDRQRKETNGNGRVGKGARHSRG